MSQNMEGELEKKCKQCAMMIPKDAKICPFCRKQLSTTLITRLAVLFIAVPVFGAIFSTTLNHKPAVRSPEEIERKKAGDDKYWAAWAAKEMISKTLKAPSTATWQDITEFEVTDVPGGKNTWQVRGYVDAENSYGAKLRSNFKAIIFKEPDGGMVLISLDTDK
jgi:predicted amidophosphoribosyltransferase